MKETEIPVQIGFEDEAFKQLNEDVEQLKRDKRDLEKRVTEQTTILKETLRQIEPNTPYRDLRLGVYLDDLAEKEDGATIHDIEPCLTIPDVSTCLLVFGITQKPWSCLKV